MEGLHANETDRTVARTSTRRDVVLGGRKGASGGYREVRSSSQPRPNCPVSILGLPEIYVCRVMHHVAGDSAFGNLREIAPGHPVIISPGQGRKPRASTTGLPQTGAMRIDVKRGRLRPVRGAFG